MGVARSRDVTRAPATGGLDAAWFDRLWVLSSDFLDQAVTESMRIEIEAKLTGDIAGDDFNALLTKGSYNTGSRVLVRRDGKLLLQLARIKEGSPLWVYSSDPLPRDRWVRIALTYTPPRREAPGEATIEFDGKSQAHEPVEAGVNPSPAVIGIGCEFTTPAQGPVGKRRPYFPGLIRSVTISPMTADASAGPSR